MSKTEAEKAEAKKKIEALIQQSKDLIRQAEDVADGYGLEFSYEPDHIGTYYGKGTTEGAYNYDQEPSDEGEWYPSSWNSSSLYC